jgi:peptide/nickel transport system ATP-binding protein
MSDTLSIKGLKVTFQGRSAPFQAVGDADLELEEGCSMAIMGESGCGKSVLALAILRLLDHANVEGHAYFNGIDLLHAPLADVKALRGKVIGLVPQSPTTAFDPVLRIGKQMSEYGRVVLGLGKEEARETAMRSLASVGFSEPGQIYDSFPYQLSGGMCERAMIALALCSRPRLLMADEPTKGLDDRSRKNVLDPLIDGRGGSSLLMITHDWQAATRCQMIAIMYAGEFLEIGPAERVSKSPSHPYVKGLIAAMPRNGMRALPPAPAPGQNESGCRFLPRCALATEECHLHPQMSSRGQVLVRCHHA